MQATTSSLFTYFDQLAIAKLHSARELGTHEVEEIEDKAQKERWEQVQPLLKIFAPPRQDFVSSPETEAQISSTIKGMDCLPNELQSLILEESESPSHYLAMRLMVRDKVVHKYAINKLAEIGKYTVADRFKMTHSETPPESYLLEHTVELILSQCSQEELERLSSHISGISHRATTFYNRPITLLVICIAITYFSSLLVDYVILYHLPYSLAFLASKIEHFVSPILMQTVSYALKFLALLHHWKWAILFGAVAVAYTPELLVQHRIPRIVRSILEKVDYALFGVTAWVFMPTVTISIPLLTLLIKLPFLQHARETINRRINRINSSREFISFLMKRSNLDYDKSKITRLLIQEMTQRPK